MLLFGLSGMRQNIVMSKLVRLENGKFTLGKTNNVDCSSSRWF